MGTDKRMGSRNAGKISRWWLTAQISLQRGESVIHQCAALRQVAGIMVCHGTLFLTTDRLVWIKWRLMPPLAKRAIEIPLTDVERFVLRPPGWKRRAAILEVKTRSRQKPIRFAPEWGEPEARRWIDIMQQVAGVVPISVEVKR